METLTAQFDELHLQADKTIQKALEADGKLQ